MKFKKVALLAALLFFVSFAAKAQSVPSLSDRLQAATLAVYQGKQVCKWESVGSGFFGPEWEWGCKFQSQFICTSTVVGSGEENGGYGYIGLTAGHCFDWDRKDDYYVAEGVSDKPVLRHIVLQKFEFDDRYDYAVFTFTSHKAYPAMDVDFDHDVLVGTKVLNVNFSLGLTKQVVPGQVVSNIISEPIPSFKSEKGRYLVNLGIGPGASGSAVVDADTGKIIGLVEVMFTRMQMHSVIMPTGKTLADFFEDDSAGLQPEPEIGVPPTPKAPAQLSPLQHFEQGLSDFWDNLKEWFWSN